MGTRGKINAIWWNIKVNLQKTVYICGYESPINLQNFSLKDLTEVKIFKKVLGGNFFWNTLYVSLWSRPTDLPTNDSTLLTPIDTGRVKIRHKNARAQQNYCKIYYLLLLNNVVIIWNCRKLLLIMPRLYIGKGALKYRHPVWYGKTRMVWLPDSEKISTCLFVLTWTTNVTDTQIDRQTPHDGIGRMHSIARQKYVAIFTEPF